MDFQCRPQDGGFRVSAIVNGRPVSGWVNHYMAQPAPNVVASMAHQAESA
jgi:hypothetical protein